MYNRSVFTPLTEELQKNLEVYADLLRNVSAHHHSIKGTVRAINELSFLMTSDRRSQHPDYLNQNKFLEAYLYYFLPWNLYRLSILSSMQDLCLPEQGIVVDLGSGPLTGVQALWLARPDLRSQRLTFFCLDRSTQAMKKGLALFTALSERQSAWNIRLIDGTFGRLPSNLLYKADLALAFNMLNEQKKNRNESLFAFVRRQARQLSLCLNKSGRMLIVEPGTRYGGRLLSLLRQSLLEQNFQIFSPCLHANSCPMLGQAKNTWCHFRYTLPWVPVWLKELTEKSGLSKSELSLSLLLAGKQKKHTPLEGHDHSDAFDVRVLSKPFLLPEKKGYYCYGCSEKGLVCIRTKEGEDQIFRPGAEIRCRPERDNAIDRKSKAAFVERVN